MYRGLGVNLECQTQLSCTNLCLISINLCICYVATCMCLENPCGSPASRDLSPPKSPETICANTSYSCNTTPTLTLLTAPSVGWLQELNHNKYIIISVTFGSSAHESIHSQAAKITATLLF